VRIAVAVLIGVVLFVGLLWALQRRLIYLPTQTIPDVQTLHEAGEEVTFTSADGLELRAWFVPAAGEPLDVAVLVLPGNAGNRSLRAPLARGLSEAGADVLLVDYRGYGGNPGRPSEAGLRSDARAARDHLAARTDVDPARIVYFGESLGAAVATDLAASEPPAGLVLRSPFTSLTDVAQVHYRFLPVRLLLWDEFPVLEMIPEIRAPVLVIAGDADRIVPTEQSVQVYEAASHPKHLVTVESAGHNDPALTDGAQMIGAIIEFVTEHVAR
jgi:uncharacterized protein